MLTQECDHPDGRRAYVGSLVKDESGLHCSVCLEPFHVVMHSLVEARLVRDPDRTA